MFIESSDLSVVFALITKRVDAVTISVKVVTDSVCYRSAEYDLEALQERVVLPSAFGF